MSNDLSSQDQIEKAKILKLTIDDPELLESFALGAIATRPKGYEQPLAELAKLAISARLDGWRDHASTLAALHIESRVSDE